VARTTGSSSKPKSLFVLAARFCSCSRTERPSLHCPNAEKDRTLPARKGSLLTVNVTVRPMYSGGGHSAVTRHSHEPRTIMPPVSDGQESKWMLHLSTTRSSSDDGEGGQPSTRKPEAPALGNAKDQKGSTMPEGRTTAAAAAVTKPAPPGAVAASAESLELEERSGALFFGRPFAGPAVVRASLDATESAERQTGTRGRTGCSWTARTRPSRPARVPRAPAVPPLLGRRVARGGGPSCRSGPS
jgi:hypothetical protein